METQHVRYFLAICDDLSFTRAAKRCAIAQPSLTTAIQRMEREIGGALLVRSARAPHVQLTALGLQLFPICIEINNLMEKAKRLVCRRQKQANGRIVTNRRSTNRRQISVESKADAAVHATSGQSSTNSPQATGRQSTSRPVLAQVGLTALSGEN